MFGIESVYKIGNTVNCGGDSAELGGCMTSVLCELGGCMTSVLCERLFTGSWCC